MESAAELAAIISIYGDSFTNCMRILDKKTEISFTVATPRARSESKEKEVKIRCGDIYEAFTTFAEGHEAALAQCQLVGHWDRLADEFVIWLTHEYTDRYRRITTDEHRIWLSEAAHWAVARRIMERKHQSHRFINPYAAQCTSAGIQTQAQIAVLCRAAHHVNKGHPEFAQRLIEEILAGYRQILHTTLEAVKIQSAPSSFMLTQGAA